MANISVATFTELNTACQTSNTITVTAPITVTSTITIPAGVTVSLTGAQLSTSTAALRHFQLNGDLELNNITLDGGTTGGGINVGNAGGTVSPTLTIDAGTIIQNCSATPSGAAIFSHTNSVVTMNAGTIQNNVTTGSANGGAVFISGTTNSDPNTSFTMNDGLITNNSNESAGAAAGIWILKGVFNFNNGTISNNSSINGTAAGINLDYATCIMKDGVVSGNIGLDGGAVRLGLAPNTFNMSGGTIGPNNIANTNGGGINVTNLNVSSTANQIVNISGGSVVGNTANINGGGIWLSSGTLSMTGGLIYNNIADADGGGIYITSGATATIAGASAPTSIPQAAPATGTPAIYNNTADGNGGGLYLTGNETTATTTNVLISGNLATNGGGYYVAP